MKFFYENIFIGIYIFTYSSKVKPINYQLFDMIKHLYFYSSLQISFVPLLHLHHPNRTEDITLTSI